MGVLVRPCHIHQVPSLHEDEGSTQKATIGACTCQEDGMACPSDDNPMTIHGSASHRGVELVVTANLSYITVQSIRHFVASKVIIKKQHIIVLLLQE